MIHKLVRYISIFSIATDELGMAATLVTPVLRRLSQEDRKFKASLSYIGDTVGQPGLHRTYLKKKY
jgi:hypothetical protein